MGVSMYVCNKNINAITLLQELNFSSVIGYQIRYITWAILHMNQIKSIIQ